MSDVDRMIEATGVTLPLAARIVGVLLDSGASAVEIGAALSIVSTVVGRLPVTYDHDTAPLTALES
jgi:hypothetical protein